MFAFLVDGYNLTGKAAIANVMLDCFFEVNSRFFISLEEYTGRNKKKGKGRLKKFMKMEMHYE